MLRLPALSKAVRGSSMRLVLFAASLLTVFFTLLDCSYAIQAEVDGNTFSEQLNRESTPEQPSTKSDISYGTHKSWYDSNKDKLRFPPASSIKTDTTEISDRHTRKIEVPPPEKDPANNPNSSANAQFYLDLMIFLGHVIWIGFWCILVGIVILIAYLIYSGKYLYVQRLWKRKSSEVDPSLGNFARDMAKVVDLPFQVESNHKSLIEFAKDSFEKGSYRQAITALFGHMLIELDAASCIRLQRGKTNRTYWRELRNEPKLRSLFNDLSYVFEAVYFGNYPLSKTEYEQYWKIIPELDQAIEKAKKNRLSRAGESNSAQGESPSALSEVGTTKLKSVSPVVLIGSCLAISALGCSTEKATSIYADISSMNATSSVGGLTAFQSLCQNKGVSANKISVLTERSKNLDAIMWVPRTFSPPTKEEISWFESWLAEKSERVFIYVGRDFSPIEDYWQQGMEQSKLSDRHVYSEKKAIASAKHDRLRNLSPPTASDWFQSDWEDDQNSVITKVKGPWADDISDFAPRIPLRSYLEYTENKQRRFSTVLLETSDGRPLITQIEDKRWSNCKFLLVANGSVLMNAGLVNHGNRRLAGRIIQTISPKGRLGILTPDRPIVIRGPDNPDELKGFELLRIWPLSLISIQAIFLGIITLLALWPVFGRPRRIAKESTTDFGKHVEAMGLLLQETNDRYYAAIKIAEYFRDVRKEPNSVWATILSEEQAITPTITTATSQSGLIQPKTTPSTTP